jgi:hypothetical protein
VRETYPFHPSFKHLVALFKENEGFRQTRGLMQFTARCSRAWRCARTTTSTSSAPSTWQLNDEQVRDEIERIAPKLMPAVTRDIADAGNAIAETIDAELDTGDAAQQVMTLLLASSCRARSVGASACPKAKSSSSSPRPAASPTNSCRRCSGCASIAWYLHREDQRFFIKETENLSRQIERNAKEVPQPKVDQALINRLTGILAAGRRKAYQDVQVLPRLDEIKLGGPRTLIVIKPDGKVPPSELQNFFDYQQEKNNLLVLTGQDSHAGRRGGRPPARAVRHRADPQAPEGGRHLVRGSAGPARRGRRPLRKALSAAYNRVYFPSTDPIDGRTSWPTSPSTTASSSARAISPPRRRSRRCWPARAPTTSWPPI